MTLASIGCYKIDLPTTTTVTPFTTAAPETTTMMPSLPLPGTCTSDKICRYILDANDQYTCILDDVNAVLTSISGNHISPAFTDASVTRIYFKNSVLPNIPCIIFEKFPNLTFLSIANSSLSLVNDQGLSCCGNVVHLDARYNNIVHVSEDALKNCTKLQTLDLTGNPLEYISGQLYLNNPDLRRIIIHRESFE